MEKTKTPQEVEIFIERLNKYFVEKIVKQEYEIVTKDTFTALIKIDNKYLFKIWIANGKDLIKTDEDSFMKLVFTKDEKAIIFHNLDNTKQSLEKAKERLLKDLEKVNSKLNSYKSEE